jgi:hypothetical protein
MKLKEWRAVWSECPYIQNKQRVAFVEAENAEEAKKLLTEAIERQGINWWGIIEPFVEHEKPKCAGTVKSF